MGRPKVKLNPVPGQRLKEIIKNEGIKQYKLAEYLGMEPESLSAIVNGKKNLTFANARKVIELFPKYDLTWLCGMDWRTSDTIGDFADFATWNEKFRALNAYLSIFGFQIVVNGSDNATVSNVYYLNDKTHDSTIRALSYEEVIHLRDRVAELVKETIEVLP